MFEVQSDEKNGSGATLTCSRRENNEVGEDCRIALEHIHRTSMANNGVEWILARIEGDSRNRKQHELLCGQAHSWSALCKPTTRCPSGRVILKGRGSVDLDAQSVVVSLWRRFVLQLPQLCSYRKERLFLSEVFLHWHRIRYEIRRVKEAPVPMRMLTCDTSRPWSQGSVKLGHWV